MSCETLRAQRYRLEKAISAKLQTSAIDKRNQASGKLGDIIVQHPNKVLAELLAKQPCTQGWHQGTLNIAEHGMIGPFNFAIHQAEQHCISKATWKEFEACDEVKDGSVDVSDLNRVTPLRQTEAQPQNNQTTMQNRNCHTNTS
jgi:hypothetical protein